MKELYEYINDLVDKIAEKLNAIHASFSNKEDKSNKKQGLSSTDSDHYPSVPAVKDGIDQAIVIANNYTNDVATGINNALEDKVDKEAGKGLSDENFTLSLKQKLETMESSKFRGTYTSLSNLKAEYPEGQSQSWHKNEGGWYADVGPANEPSERYIWDHNDFEWVAGGAGGITAEQVKNLYESNDDTNALTDVRKTKLDGVETGAQKNVQADMNETDQTKDSFVKNKKTKLSQFENDSKFVKEIIKVEGVGALEGGGKLDNDIEIDLKQETKDDIADGVSAKELVNNLGVRNYFPLTYLPSNIDKGINYFEGPFWAVTILNENRVKELFEPNTDYIIRYEVELLEKGNGALIQADRLGNFRFYSRNNSSSVYLTPPIDVQDYENAVVGSKFKIKGRFKSPTNLDGFELLVYNANTSGGGSNIFRFLNVKIEKGLVATDWSPAPYDLLFKEEANTLFAPLTGYPDWAQELEDLLNF